MSMTTLLQSIVAEDREDSDMAIPDEYWELLSQYRDELIKQAAAIVGNNDDAEDVVQETFSEAAREPEKLTKAKSLGGWLKTINRGNAMDFVRRRKVRHNTADRKGREMPARAFTTGGMSALEMNDFIAKAIEQLPAKHRAVVVLHYWQHLSHEEIAQRQHLPIGTVKWLLYDAAIRLHGRLKTLRPDASTPDQTTSPETDK
jgi:RNA polymerase sigma-70 factor (ECF subfamily)